MIDPSSLWEAGGDMGEVTSRQGWPPVIPTDFQGKGPEWLLKAIMLRDIAETHIENGHKATKPGSTHVGQASHRPHF